MTFANLRDRVSAMPGVILFTGAGSDKAGWRVAFLDDATADQRAAVQALIDACPADAPLVRTATGRQLRYALNSQGWRAAWDAAVTASKKPDDRDYWTTLGSGDAAPENNPKLIRIAAACQPPVDLRALYDAALTAA